MGDGPKLKAKRKRTHKMKLRCQEQANPTDPRRGTTHRVRKALPPPPPTPRSRILKRGKKGAKVALPPHVRPSYAAQPDTPPPPSSPPRSLSSPSSRGYMELYSLPLRLVGGAP